MGIEHTIRDVDRPFDSANPDEELDRTLARMGREGWELVAVLPTDHAADSAGTYVVSALRLFFKRGATQAGPGVIPTSGVNVSAPGKKYAALAVYCPPSWIGTTIRLSAIEFEPSQIFAQVVGRQAAPGSTVAAAVFANLKLRSFAGDVFDAELRVEKWPERPGTYSSDYSKAGLDKNASKVSVMDGSVVEVDWRWKSALPEPPARAR
jgi:hypothetical protein